MGTWNSDWRKRPSTFVLYGSKDYIWKVFHLSLLLFLKQDALIQEEPVSNVLCRDDRTQTTLLVLLSINREFLDKSSRKFD